MVSTMEKKLRAGTLFSSVGAFAMLIPATIHSARHYSGWYRYYKHNTSVIGFLFIPLFFTIVTSALHVLFQRIRKDKEQPIPYPQLWLLADFSIFSGYMIALVFEWTKGVHRLDSDPGLAFLEAYTTVPLMANMLAHMVLFLLNARTGVPAMFSAMFSKEWRKPAQCPHCHHNLGKKAVEVEQKGTGEGYSLLRGEDYDEDAARRASEDAAEASADKATVGTIVDV